MAIKVVERNPLNKKKNFKKMRLGRATEHEIRKDCWRQRKQRRLKVWDEEGRKVFELSVCKPFLNIVFHICTAFSL